MLKKFLQYLLGMASRKFFLKESEKTTKKNTQHPHSKIECIRTFPLSPGLNAILLYLFYLIALGGQIFLAPFPQRSDRACQDAQQAPLLPFFPVTLVESQEDPYQEVENWRHVGLWG